VELQPAGLRGCNWRDRDMSSEVQRRRFRAVRRRDCESIALDFSEEAGCLDPATKKLGV